MYPKFPLSSPLLAGVLLRICSFYWRRQHSVVIENVDSGVSTAWVQILTLWLNIFVTLGSLFNIPWVSFIICKMNVIIPIHSVTVRIETIYVNRFKQYSLNLVIITKSHFVSRSGSSESPRVPRTPTKTKTLNPVNC